MVKITVNAHHVPEGEHNYVYVNPDHVTMLDYDDDEECVIIYVNPDRMIFADGTIDEIAAALEPPVYLTDTAKPQRVEI